jgi:long-subunit fatty acid transport protein
MEIKAYGNKKGLGIFIIVSFVSSLTLQAAGTSSAQFLKMGAGARAAAMGEAFTSVADDATSTYWNPAGLPAMQDSQISVMHNSHLEGSQYQHVSAGIKREAIGFGVFIQRLDFGSIEKYSAANAREGNFEAGSIAGGFSVGKVINAGLNFGVTGKFIEESIESEKATTFAGDFGLLIKREKFNLGLSLLHVGPGMKFVNESASLPQTMKAGISTKLREGKLLLSGELSKPKDSGMAYHAGAELVLNKSISTRAGFKATSDEAASLGGLSGISGGLGIKVGRIQLDYAVVPFGDLGMSQKVSLLFHFSQN